MDEEMNKEKLKRNILISALRRGFEKSVDDLIADATRYETMEELDEQIEKLLYGYKETEEFIKSYYDPKIYS